MNQYRCETCRKKCRITVIDAEDGKSISFNPQDPFEKTLWFVQGISQVGCASHSDFQSEREMVLNELQYKLRRKMQCAPSQHTMILDMKDVDAIFIELRQAGDVS